MKKFNPYKNSWISIYPNFYNFTLTYALGGYFDSRPEIRCSITQIISIIGLIIFGFKIYSLFFVILFFIQWGDMYIYLPFKTKYDECDPPEYGVYYHSRAMWFKLGRKIKSYDFPFAYNWIRTSALKKDGTWEHETKNNRKDFYKDKWNDILWTEEYQYTYVLNSGKVQKRIAKIQVEEREWRQKWLKWTSLYSKRRKVIDVKFYPVPFRHLMIEKNNNINKHKQTGEVGERTGSYKGGTIGCGYDMLKDETPLQTLRRMEKERKFN